MPKSIPGLDLLKYIMAIMIVAIHATPFEGMSIKPWLLVIMNWGVPVFFMLSSLFFMRKVREKGAEWSLLRSYLKRIGLMYGIWFIINLPIYVSQHYANFEFVYFLKSIFFSSSFQGSWFLSALALSISVIFIIVRYRVPSWLVMFALLVEYQIIYSWSAGIDFYETHFAKPITLSFPRALLWVYMGYTFSSPKFVTMMNRLSQAVWKHLLLIPIVILWLIGGIYIPEWPYRVSLILTVPILCVYFYTLQLPASPLWLYLRNYSILYYLLHFMTLVYMRNLFPLDFTGLARWGVCLLIVTVVSTIILYCEKKPSGKWMKYIH